MATSNNNLKAVLKDTADAIRSKTGSNALIVPRQFADTISSITKITYTPEESSDVIKALYSGTVVNAVVPDGVSILHPYLFYGMTSLQSVDFNEIEVIPMDCCYACSNLTSVQFFTHTTQIGNYAFWGCTKFEDTELPHTLTIIGDYAFQNAGSYYSMGTHTFTMIDNVGVHTTIGQYAFQNSHLSEIDAYTNNIGTYAFGSCKSLTDVNLEIHGSIGDSAFVDCYYVENFEINANSVITSLGNSAFSSLASGTAVALRNISPFDFRNSTFTSVGNSVWRNITYDGVIYFPSTLATISGNFLNNAAGNWTLYFNSVPTVSNSSYLRNDSSDFTVKYCFPYELLDTASSATNWSSHTSQMVGYGTGYAVGTTLPQYARTSGVAISWYTDIAMTTPITVSTSATDVYYCSLGSTRVVWFVDTPTLVDGAVSISDGVNTYTDGDAIPVNTSITITPSATDNTKTILYMLTVNGVDYTSSGSATITMTQDLAITVIYWDGVNQPILPNLADNSWALIQIASKNNTIPATWQVGDTKTLTYNGVNYTARLVDKTGKYKRVSDNSTAYLKFELTELLPDSEVYHSSSNNRPLQSQLLDKMNSGTIYNNIDSSLTSIIEKVKVEVSQGGGSSTENTLVNFEGKFFLQREHDLFSTRTYSVQAEWNAISAQDEYYQTHNTDSDRIKRKQGSTSGTGYWEISPRAGDNGSVCSVDYGGNADRDSSNGSNGVALCFAL